MFFVDTIEVSGLGNRSYLAGGARTAVAVDLPRDFDQVIAAAARRGVRITHVAETHVHNDVHPDQLALGGGDLLRRLGEQGDVATRCPRPGLHCAGGLRAAVAASLLHATGRDVVAVDDGFDSAGRAGLTVRTS